MLFVPLTMLMLTQWFFKNGRENLGTPPLSSPLQKRHHEHLFRRHQPQPACCLSRLMGYDGLQPNIKEAGSGITSLHRPSARVTRPTRLMRNRDSYRTRPYSSSAPVADSRDGTTGDGARKAFRKAHKPLALRRSGVWRNRASLLGRSGWL